MNITIELEGKKYAGVLALVDETPAVVTPVAEPAVESVANPEPTV
jgi:hypothetical protein